MKKNYLLLLILSSTIGLNAQTTFNPATDYMFADFEGTNNVYILDASGNQTSSLAIAGAWNAGGTPGQASNLIQSTSTVDTSSGAYKFGIGYDKSSGGIYINILDWSKSILDYKSVRFKIYTAETDIVGTTGGLKVNVGQYSTGGGLKVKIDSVAVTYGSDWLEFTYDISSLQQASNSNPWQYVEVALYNLPVRASGSYSKYFRIDEIIFSTNGLTTVASNNMTPNNLILYNHTTGYLNVTDENNDAVILVYDVFGQLVKSAKQVSKLSVSDLTPGIYVAQVSVGGNKQSLKFLR